VGEDRMGEALRGLSARDCYARVHAYLRAPSLGAGRGAARWLPDPSDASEQDIDLVLGEVVHGGLDAVFRSPDEHGIPLSAYARQALEIRYGASFLASGRFRESCRASSLFPKLARRL